MIRPKESPRQRVIGILYLVLLGLIALNVNNSVLDAFKSLGDSLYASAQYTQSGIDQMFFTFRNTKLKESPLRALPILHKAELAQAMIQELTAKIDEYSDLMIIEGGGIEEETGDVHFRGSTDIATRIMLNEGRGRELKTLIDKTTSKLQELTNNEISFSLSSTDPVSNEGIAKRWEDVNFGKGIPLTAAITALKKITVDAKNTEAAVIKHIFGQMDLAVMNLDQFSAIAIAPTSYLIAGQPYTAKLFLTAFDSKSKPSITVNGRAVPVSEGQGTYSITPGIGIHTWKGIITVQQTDGGFKAYETQPVTFQVAKPSAVVSPDAMNVLYIGVYNPLSISAPGVASDNLKLSGAGVTLITKGAGKYIAKVSSPGDVSLTVSAFIAGKNQNLGTSTFRVKRLPKPIARVGGKTGGRISVAQLRGQSVISVALDNFDFDAKFSVSRFNMYIAKPRVDPIGPFSAQGNSFSTVMKSAINELTSGSVVMIYDIIGIGPDGFAHNLEPITFQVTN